MATESGDEVRHRDWLEFSILGPLEVAVGPERLDLGGIRQQVVLATLLLSANNVVSVGRLQEAIYGEDLPPTSRSQAQMSISSLRRLFASHGYPTSISTRPQGYLVQVGDGQLDSRRFAELVNAAGADRDAGRLERAVAGYRDALRLWRGPALDGLDSLLLLAAASSLDEQRIAANEDLITVQLDLGRHHELVGELGELVAKFPLRERLRGLLMLALYRCGRVAEALRVYRQARRAMVDELGIEPSEQLGQLERAILGSDPSLDLQAPSIRVQPQRPHVPGLLPADIADFTGRAGQVSVIRQHLIHPPRQHARRAMPVVVITGQGGVGKTSMAVHASHEVADHFGDGQLFADLHGGGTRQVGPMQVLERFLRALGVPGAKVPEGLDERAEMYRNLLAGRRILVVLDDAVAESQVLPLLPGSGAAAAMITSRGRLAGLPGASVVELDVLDADRSLDLLGRIAGADRVQAQPEAAAAVAARCGHLPLALRIAGARLAARRHWDFQQLADRLADETRRLDELEHGDMGVRASISLSYEGASEPAKQLLRRLALLEMPTYSGWLSAALLDQPLADAEDLLDDLVSAQLVETTRTGSGVHSQYRLHELIRVFARERLAAEEPAAEQEAALERALGALLYLAGEACRRFDDYLPLASDARRWPLPAPLVEQLVSDPLAWFERERVTIASAVRQAARAGLVELCWSLVQEAEPFYESRAYFDDWQQTADIALQAARKAQHVRGQAAMLYIGGTLHLEQQRYEAARRNFDAAEQLFLDVGDEYGLALVTRNAAFVDRVNGRLGDATRRYEAALSTFRSRGDHASAAAALVNLALVKMHRHELDAATELLTEAERLTGARSDTRLQAQVLYVAGETRLLAGEPAHALSMLEPALALVRDLGDPVGEANILRAVGLAKLAQGETDQARSALESAVAAARSANEQLGEARALHGLAELALTSGDPGQAVILGQRALAALRAMGAQVYLEELLSLLGEAHAALGDSAAAQTARDEAAALRA